MIDLFKKDIFYKLNNKWLFEFLIVLLFIGVSFLGWYFSYSYSGFLICLLSIILLFIFNDFKYIIPASLCIIFSYNGGFEPGEFPMEIALYAGLFIFIIVLYTISNFKIKSFKKGKSFIGILALSIICFVPIFWNEAIVEDRDKMLYAIYLTWFLYLFVFFVFIINLKGKNTRMMIFTISLLSLLISLECITKVFQLHLENPDKSILSISYNVGWGICNEAGIMLCFSMPFTFYLLLKSKNTVFSLFNMMLICISLFGIVLTTSRATLFFGLIEAGLLAMLLIIFSKNRLLYLASFVFVISLALAVIGMKYNVIDFVISIKDKIFADGLGDTGRICLYEKAMALWTKNFVNMTFGSGIISEIEGQWYNGTSQVVYLVYHSTFFETIVMGGIVGLLALIFHLFEKYKQLYKKDLAFALAMAIGYFLVDIYGLIDNTYGMYYYMVPLVIVMASLDVDKDVAIFETKRYNNYSFSVLY